MFRPINIIIDILVLFNYPAASNIIDCSHNDSCIASTILCDTTDDCHIVCNEPNICNSKTFICPTKPNTQCNIYCTDLSCLYTKFDASDANGIHLKLFLNSNSNQNVWSYGSLICPPNGDCSITSTNDKIQHNHITALNSNSLNITAFNIDSNSNILSETTIFCPTQDSIYCDINIYNGILSNANIYAKNIQFLWLICKTKRNCYDNKQISTIYCGEKYVSKCDVTSETAFSNCICNFPIISTQQVNNNTSLFSTNTVNARYSQENNNSFWETKHNLYYIIITLISVILVSILVLCGFGIYFKMKIHSVELEQLPPPNVNKHKIEAYAYCNNKHIFKKTKHKTHQNNLQVASLVTPVSSYQSGISSFRLTANNLFDVKNKNSVVPIPPIPVEPKTVSEFEYDCVDESDWVSYGDRNLQLNIKQSEQIFIPAKIIIENDSEANLMSIIHGIRERGLTNIPKIPLDVNCNGEHELAANSRQKHVNDDSDANSVSVSTINDEENVEYCCEFDFTSNGE